MIDEARAVQADLAARATFAKDGETIKDTRAAVEELIEVSIRHPSWDATATRTASKLAAADAAGLIEVG